MRRERRPRAGGGSSETRPPDRWPERQSSAAPLEPLQTAASPGVIVHGNEGLKIPATPDGRVITIKIDSEQTPGLRMSMIAEDLPPKAEIRVHLHSNEDEIIFIRMGPVSRRSAIARCPLAAGATVDVPQGRVARAPQ